MKKWMKSLLIAAGILGAAGSVMVGTACAAGNFRETEEIAGPEEVFSYSVEAQGIRSLELDWVAGNVIIEPYEGEEILLEERGCGSAPEKYRLHWELDGDSLEIQFYKNGFRFGLRDKRAKDLRIRIPAELAGNLEELEIQDVSSRIHLADLTVRELSYETVSGSLKGLALNAEEVELESVSGSVQCQLTACPGELSVETVSGDAEIMLPRESTFRTDLKTVSGKIQSEFPHTEAAGPEFKMHSVSGDLIIRSAE